LSRKHCELVDLWLAADRSATRLDEHTERNKLTMSKTSSLHSLEDQALKHLWMHSTELDWEDMARGELPIYVEGRGSTLVDVHGREFLDGLAGLYVVAVGHGRAEIGEAMAEQAGRIAYTAPSSATNPAAIALADKISELTPGDLDRIFLCSGGSEAVETALKIAKQVQFLRGFPKRNKIIARRGSYHGMTFGAASLTSRTNDVYFGPMMAGVSKVPSPNSYRNDFGLEGRAGDLMCARYVEQEILAQGPETVAAVIAEPISAANGTHLPSGEYWRSLREICDRHGVLLIMDEVITGWGRTGKMFAADQFGVVPDLMTMAKGITSGYAPLGAVAVKSSVFDDFRPGGKGLNHLLTFGGQAVAAVAALKNIEILEREQLVARSAEMGAHLFQLLQKLYSHPTVGDIRGGMGLLCAVEFVKDRTSKESWGMTHPFVKYLGRRVREEGLVTRSWNVLDLAPPFVVTRSELERMVEIVDRCLTEAETKFSDEIR
jgi:adenosylmethionine-8-amino-7-oxononanoate aminotransferase